MFVIYECVRYDCACVAPFFGMGVCVFQCVCARTQICVAVRAYLNGYRYVDNYNVLYYAMLYVCIYACVCMI